MVKITDKHLFFILAILVILVGIVYFHNIQIEKKPVSTKALKQSPPAEERTTGQPAAEEELPEENLPGQGEEEAIIAEEKPKLEGNILYLDIPLKPREQRSQEIEIDVGTTVVWRNLEDRRHYIKCFVGDIENIGYNFFIGYAQLKGDTITYTFNEKGTFRCIHGLYGYDWIIHVNEEKSSMEITGKTVKEAFNALVRDENGLSLGTVSLALLAGVWLSYYFYKHAHKIG